MKKIIQIMPVPDNLVILHQEVIHGECHFSQCGTQDDFETILFAVISEDDYNSCTNAGLVRWDSDYSRFVLIEPCCVEGEFYEIVPKEWLATHKIEEAFY